MVLTSGSDGTTPCPECGEPMPMVSWTGSKPKCHQCVDSTTVRIGTGSGGRSFGSSKREPCLHEGLDRLQPVDHSSTHMLACPCPKCSWRC